MRVSKDLIYGTHTHKTEKNYSQGRMKKPWQMFGYANEEVRDETDSKHMRELKVISPYLGDQEKKLDLLV